MAQGPTVVRTEVRGEGEDTCVVEMGRQVSSGGKQGSTGPALQLLVEWGSVGGGLVRQMSKLHLRASESYRSQKGEQSPWRGGFWELHEELGCPSS